MIHLHEVKLKFSLFISKSKELCKIQTQTKFSFGDQAWFAWFKATKPDLLDLRRPSHICLIQCFIWNSLTGTQPISCLCNRTFIFNFLVINDFIFDVLNILPVSLLFIQESFQVLESDVHEVNKKIQIEDWTRVYCFLLHRIVMSNLLFRSFRLLLVLQSNMLEKGKRK